MKTELIKCPFCGGNASMEGNEGDPVHYAYCLNTICRTYGPSKRTAKEAAEAWNRRTPHPVSAQGFGDEVSLPVVAHAVMAPKGGVHKLCIKLDSAERKRDHWLNEWPDNQPYIAKLADHTTAMAEITKLRAIIQRLQGKAEPSFDLVLTLQHEFDVLLDHDDAVSNDTVEATVCWVRDAIMPIAHQYEATAAQPVEPAWQQKRIDKLEAAIQATLDAVAKYPEHPMTASEVILRRAIYKPPAPTQQQANGEVG